MKCRNDKLQGNESGQKQLATSGSQTHNLHILHALHRFSKKQKRCLIILNDIALHHIALRAIELRHLMAADNSVRPSMPARQIFTAHEVDSHCNIVMLPPSDVQQKKIAARKKKKYQNSHQRQQWNRSRIVFITAAVWLTACSMNHALRSLTWLYKLAFGHHQAAGLYF